MKRKAPREQLGLWDTIEDTSSTEPPPVPELVSPDDEQLQQIQRKPYHSESDIEVMRAWLLEWGKKYDYPGFSFPFHYPPRNEDADRRFGWLVRGKRRWEECVQRPNQRERYPGEWFVKCIEHVQRFESGVHSMPWKEFNLYEPSTEHQGESDEE